MSSRGSTTGESTSGRTDGQCDREIGEIKQILHHNENIFKKPFIH